MEKLDDGFYLNTDVLKLAKALLGKVLTTNINSQITSGRIIETEAYAGITDRASHAFGGRRTKRTEVMYMQGGHAYVYLCYGIHQMLNVVTNLQNVPHAILIRSILPIDGLQIMLQRTNKNKFVNNVVKGPGLVGKALGIHTSQSGISLQGNSISIYDDGHTYQNAETLAGPRIGVAYAGEDALLPYRFLVKEFFTKLK